MTDGSGGTFSVWVEGTEGLDLSTRGELTLTSDRLVLVTPPRHQPDIRDVLEIPLGEGATATAAPTVGQPEAKGYMVTVRWEGKSVRFLDLSEDDATAIARHVGIEAAPS